MADHRATHPADSPTEAGAGWAATLLARTNAEEAAMRDDGQAEAAEVQERDATWKAEQHRESVAVDGAPAGSEPRPTEITLLTYNVWFDKRGSTGAAVASSSSWSYTAPTSSACRR